MKAVNVFCLLEGDVLAKDVYKGNSLILKADTYLTRESITKLKKWKINAVEIKSTAEMEEFDLAATLNISPYLPTPPLSILKRIFFENLTQVGHEYRYGSVLYEANDYQWLESLFIKFMSNSTIFELTEKLKAWDYQSYKHAFDVFILGSLFARRMNITDLEEFSLGCLLHDIGKLAVPQHILMKPAKLTMEEYNLVKTHPASGFRLLKKLQFSEYIVNLAKSHHERSNGKGYPEGITDISDDIKILSIVDVYSALTLERPHRQAFDTPAAQQLLIEEINLVDENLLYEFFLMLDIYPLNTIVELTNGTWAKVANTNIRMPFFPVLLNVDNSSTFHMPLNKSLKVAKIIKFNDYE